jgi:hypothetical protein
MDDAVVKLASKITVATLAHQSVCALLNFEISFPFRKSGLDQQVEKHQLAAAGRGEIVRRLFGDVAEGAWNEPNSAAINSQAAGAL